MTSTTAMTTLWWVRGCPRHLAQAHERAGLTAIGPDLVDRSGAIAVLAGAEEYSADVMDALPNMKVLARIGIGYDAVDVDAATERGIMVTNTPEGPTTSTAEHTIALMMAVTHELKSSALRLRAATGDYVSHQNSMELQGRTLGLLGYGRIGRAVAIMAEAIGMNVIITDPMFEDSVSIDELLARSDVFSIHAPATPSTIGLIDRDALGNMKQGSVLINCARGPIVVTDDLVDALRSGHLMGAGLDVTEPEPLDPDHPLLHMDNVIVTPHIASNTTAGRARMERMAFEQVQFALAGERPTHLLNEHTTDFLNPPEVKD
ncbi:MAG: phosphoglycerate dehydrogenase-like enzyme [Verrucomicrobiales bacterium]|jgi:phosphoglycerate dehydrogenase-like enzyme